MGDSLPAAKRRRPLIGFWIGVILLGLSFAASRVMAVGEPDTAWHIRQADQLMQHRWFEYPDDQTSFTVPGRKYVNTEWLAELPLYLAWHSLGWTGLILYASLAAFLSVILLAKVALDAAPRRPYFALAGTSLATGAVSLAFEPRPACLNVILISAGILLANRFAASLDEPRRARRFAGGIIALQLAWTQTHGSFILLPPIVGLALVGAATREGLSRASVRRAARGLWVPVLLAFAFLCSPFGLRYFSWVLPIFYSDVGFHILEMRPMRLSDLVPQRLNTILWLDLLIAIAGLRAFVARRLELRDLGLATCGMILTFMAHRFRVVWAAFLLPFTVRDYGEGEQRHDALLALLGTTLVLPLTIAATVERFPDRGFGFFENRDAYASDTTDVIQKLALEGNIFNRYEDGGYLSARLAPRVRISIDGRTPTLFDDELFYLHRRAYESPTPFSLFEERHHPDLALIDRRKGLCSALARSPEWKAIYFDSIRTLFVRAEKAGGLRTLATVDPCAPETWISGVCSRTELPEPLLDSARAELDTLVELHPTAVFPLHLRALLELRCHGDAGRAAALAARALATGTRNYSVHLFAAEAMFAAGDVERAIAIADRATVLGDETQARLLKGHIEKSVGRFAEAADDLGAAAEVLHDILPISARMDLSESLAHTGRRSLAIFHARRALLLTRDPMIEAWLTKLESAPTSD